MPAELAINVEHTTPLGGSAPCGFCGEPATHILCCEVFHVSKAQQNDEACVCIIACDAHLSTFHQPETPARSNNRE